MKLSDGGFVVTEKSTLPRPRSLGLIVTVIVHVAPGATDDSVQPVAVQLSSVNELPATFTRTGTTSVVVPFTHVVVPVLMICTGI